ncbi:TonB-dependent receptor [Phenylobacterium sp.]|jgi:outer membrane receptor protein involved in Fe transport|uniref:TonB-dependent receptor n=1 Tax=Phenylobacterium sp. TaxID=1871053 RepID=UPI002E35B12B|nr:TonB-dependent receptor [Phenylobacterium sp.]HEX2560691.1 TonB-dependent receptor [Phenylobacterium sp.]
MKRHLLASSALALSLIASDALAQETRGTVVEELVVTAQRREEALQDVPIAVSAFDQGALERSRIEGGPNLVTAVPNVNFSKSNFTGYNFQIRGIGSKLVAASGDAGTGIHLNNAPLISNNLFETEFYDVERVEVLRGPQGTLYGRNATGGVVNIITAKPTDQFEALLRGEYGNYNTIKLRGMVNLPLNEMLALRVAGNYLKRDGFGDNLVTGNDADDRDLYGVRATLAFEPTDTFRATLLWDHFEEDDNRSRIGKQFCAKDVGPANIGGAAYSAVAPIAQVQRGFFSQGCLPSSLYDPASLGTVNSQATLGGLFGALGGFQTGDAYAGKMQTPNIRDIESTFDPIYRSETDIYELIVDWDITDELRLSWLAAFTDYSIYTRQDYNRYTPSTTFNTTPNPVNALAAVPGYSTVIYPALVPGGVINDPQNGAFNRFTTSDISAGDTEQWSHEVRLQSNFEGPFNFNLGGNLLEYKSVGDYYVMFNTGTGWYQINNFLATGNANCVGPAPCVSIDPNFEPDRTGHNYYDAFSRYELSSRAVFGELYWQMAENFKWTLGLRHTIDTKDLQNNSVTLGTPGFGLGPPLPGTPAILHVEFKETTGRFGFDWQPDLGFTNDTLVYAFLARGYKAGGLNSPPSPGIGVAPVPPTFAPEFINSIEVGSKNTLLDGTLQVNVAAFHYDYEGYQVSKIINRASTNENIDAKVKGLEFEGVWQPLEGLRLNAAIGYLNTEIGDTSSIDTFNRTQGNPNLVVVKSSAASNCVVPLATAQTALAVSNAGGNPFTLLGLCTLTSTAGAGTNILGSGAIASGTNAFGGLVSEGVPVDIGGHELPNAPEWTLSLGAQYTMNFGDWSATLRGDYYKQTETFARIYNSPADRIDSWQNVNLTLTVANLDMGVEFGAFVKNATDEEAITDFYLTDDSSGLFRNVFYTEPQTFGVWVQKRF